MSDDWPTVPPGMDPDNLDPEVVAGLWQKWVDEDPNPFRKGDQVRIVGGLFGGQLGEVRGWDGEAYEVLVRNQSGFPWYVQLSPTQVETP